MWTGTIARVRSLERRLRGGDVEAERVGLDVDQDRRRVDGERRRRGGDEGQRRRRSPRRPGRLAGGERGLHALRAVGQGEAVAGALQLGELGGPAVRLLAAGGGPGAGLEHLAEELALAVVPLRPGRPGLARAHGVPLRIAGRSPTRSGYKWGQSQKARLKSPGRDRR